METVRRCVKLHDDDDCTNLDISRWLQIDIKRKAIGKDSIGNKCLLTRIKEALDIGDYETASGSSDRNAESCGRSCGALYNLQKKSFLKSRR